MSSAISDLAHLRRIRLELAREKGNPEGNSGYGYEVIAALTPDGRIDADLWKEQRDRFRVLRFRPDGDKDFGHLVRRPGGSWAFLYDIAGDSELEAGHHFEDERFVVGEYVAIREGDRQTHTYRVVSVERP
ncbi:hypothetical protein IZ6_04100 [Terrihabitans soli]|uniref:Uncharacterized protein n=1 Tax=Terrihabitans soli TaxID=708113 RepID=A0A6S6QPH0_9HYPH|nr:hypothetical protein [Terrihabitans soli]BCJ89675.1 hypothetical protein IZ6_04100 [Terrihabitans soli]